MDDPWKEGKNGTDVDVAAAAAPQSRSRRRRIAHPLLGDPGGGSAPPRSREAEDDGSSGEEGDRVVYQFGDLLRESVAAARLSPGRADGGGDGGAAGDPSARRTTSYASSVGAMAAHVEASSRASKARHRGRGPPSRRSPPDDAASRAPDARRAGSANETPPPRGRKSTSPPTPKKRNSGGGRVSKGGEASLGKSAPGKPSLGKPRRSAVPKEARAAGEASRSAAPPKRAWRIAVPILLAFLACELFLWLLVFRSREGSGAGGPAPVPREGATGDVVGDVPDAVGADGPDPVHRGVAAVGEGEKGEVEGGAGIVGGDPDATDPNDDAPFSEPRGGRAAGTPRQESDADTGGRTSGSGISEPRGESAVEAPPEESDMSAVGPTNDHALDAEESPDDAALINGEIERLQTSLEDGFARLRGQKGGSDDRSDRASVESLCGQVWVVANENLLSGSLDGASGERGIDKPIDNKLPEITLEEIKKMASINPWKSLGLESQRCLGGAGLAFLTDEVDLFRLGLSAKIFDRLSYLEPYDPNVRAGLGTSLLLESIFHQDIDDLSEAASDEAHQLLLRARYHLNMASFLSSVSPSTVAWAAADNASFGETNVGAISRRSSNAGGKNAATTAAVLHNLALAHIALGDDVDSVPFLLHAAALRSEHPDASRPYWNAPHEVLRAAEERALTIGARAKRAAREGKRRMPFLGADFNVGEIVGEMSRV